MEAPFYDCLSPAQLHHDWQAELFARAAARAHFWLAEAPPAMTHQTPAAIAPRPPPRSHFVTRSQILGASQVLNPEELEGRLRDIQQMIPYSHSPRQAVPSLLHPENASGTTRPLRPPDAEGKSIRAPPHRPADRGEATSEGVVPVLRLSLAFTVAVPGTRITSKEWNKFPTTARTWLSPTRRRVLNQACVSLVRPEARKSRPAKDKFMAVRPSLASLIEIGDY